MRSFQKMRLVAVSLLVIMGLAGCSFFESDHDSPTAPVPGSAEQLLNFSAGQSEGNAFGVYKRPDAFAINVPAGSYQLNYTTRIGTFHVVFQAFDATLIAIGLQPGDDVMEASIQQGTIPDGAQPIESTALVATFFLPGYEATIPLTDVFVVNPAIAVVILVQGGQIVDDDDLLDLPGLSTQFGIYTGAGFFQVYVPGGDYFVEYTTASGTFQVVFRAARPDVFTINLLNGETVINVSISAGTIPASAVPLETIGGMIVFYTPGCLITWQNVFIILPSFIPVILVQQGVIIISPIIIIIPFPIGLIPIEDGVYLWNGYQITFEGVVYAGTTSTWSYHIEELPWARSLRHLSHLVIELPRSCITEANIINVTPEPWKYVDPDHHTGLYGIEWPSGRHFLPSGDITFTLNAAYPLGFVGVAAKHHDHVVSMLPGPACP